MILQRPSAKGLRIRIAVAVTLLVLVTGCREQTREPPVRTEGLTYNRERTSFRPAKLPALEAAGSSDRRIASLLNVPRTLNYGDFIWDDRNVPPASAWVLVDLQGQTLSVFRGQHEVGTAVILFGVDDKLTPTGAFTILERRKNHRSNLYDAPMPYTLRLTNDGIAIHGSDVREGAATHGCIGVPTEFGKRLFEELRTGDEVVILADARGVTAQF